MRLAPWRSKKRPMRPAGLWAVPGRSSQAHSQTRHHVWRGLSVRWAFGPEGHVITPLVESRGNMIRPLAPWRRTPYMTEHDR